MVEWQPEGIVYEADQRHADLIIDGLGLTWESNGVGTPSVRETVSDVSPLSSCDATIYRALVARANYLSQDRLDIAFAVKELCRQMASPRTCDWNALKRLGRYLVGRPRVVCRFAH